MTKPRGGQVRLLPAKGQPSACELDWENDPDFDEEPGYLIRARAADWQLHEAERLAREFALLRRGTYSGEIKDKHIRGAGRIAKTWDKLAAELRSRSKRQRR